MKVAARAIIVYRQREISVWEQDLAWELKNSPKNKATLEEIYKLIDRVLDLKNELYKLQEKLE